MHTSCARLGAHQSANASPHFTPGRRRHSLQADEAVAPVDGVVMAAEQYVQLGALISALYEPAAHAWHSPVASSLKFPAPQSEAVGRSSKHVLRALNTWLMKSFMGSV